ncbi:MAG: EthD family reductase [Acidobacteria bacterium]|nr:EthD family reductase [Acidobacteriota bacterium]
MIKVTVLYPSGEGKTFDMDYYCNVHRPLSRKVFGEACKSFDIDYGLSGPFPGSTPPYLAIGHLTFESVDAFMEIMMPNAAILMEDIPRFTNASPVVQIGEIVS